MRLRVKPLKEPIMYELLVKWVDDTEMKRTITSSKELGKFTRILKGGVRYAQITTPSGVTKDCTELFQ